VKTGILAAAVAAALLAAPAAVRAHVTLEQQEAAAGTNYRATFRVPHGCEGEATTAIRVRIPAGVARALPMPKAGWELSTEKGPLPQPISDGHGGQITEGVTEVRWTGGRLLHEHYDEFVVRVRLPDAPGTTLWFPVVQECENGKVSRWIEVPAEGAAEPRYPAARLRLVARN